MTSDRRDRERMEVLVADRGPTVLRIALGSRLRRFREDSGISLGSAADHIRGSNAKISRLELGRTGFRERDICDLLDLYGITEPDRREAVLELARRANQAGWWQSYSDLLAPWFETYLGLEQAAVSIRTYETQFVPGLLQTEGYARAVVRLGAVDDADRRVEMRMRRQHILTRSSPTTLWAVIDEGALHRPVGGPDVLRSQIRHLIDVSQLPTVKLQVVPFSAGGHPAAGGPFSILRFAEPELVDVVYAEQLTSALYMDKRRDVEVYLTVMNTLSVQALPPEDTVEFLRSLLHR